MFDVTIVQAANAYRVHIRFDDELTARRTMRDVDAFLVSNFISSDYLIEYAPSDTHYSVLMRSAAQALMAKCAILAMAPVRNMDKPEDRNSSFGVMTFSSPA